MGSPVLPSTFSYLIERPRTTEAWICARFEQIKKALQPLLPLPLSLAALYGVPEVFLDSLENPMFELWSGTYPLARPATPYTASGTPKSLLKSELYCSGQGSELSVELCWSTAETPSVGFVSSWDLGWDRDRFSAAGTNLKPHLDIVPVNFTPAALEIYNTLTKEDGVAPLDALSISLAL